MREPSCYGPSATTILLASCHCNHTPHLTCDRILPAMAKLSEIRVVSSRQCLFLYHNCDPFPVVKSVKRVSARVAQRLLAATQPPTPHCPTAILETSAVLVWSWTALKELSSDIITNFNYCHRSASTSCSRHAPPCRSYGSPVSYSIKSKTSRQQRCFQWVAVMMQGHPHVSPRFCSSTPSECFTMTTPVVSDT